MSKLEEIKTSNFYLLSAVILKQHDQTGSENQNRKRFKKGVLISYTIGDKAAVIASQNDAWKADMLHQNLSPYFGNIKDMIEKQTNYYWGDDEISLGAYATYGKGQWFGLQPILKKPFLNTHFAGEHLADWQGFMEGAINTGEEAADAIL